MSNKKPAAALPPELNEGAWLTSRDAAKRLNVHPRTILRYCELGWINHLWIREKSIVRVNADSLTEFIGGRLAIAGVEKTGEDDFVLSIRDVANAFSIDYRSALLVCRNSQIKYLRLPGGSIRISKLSLQNYIRFQLRTNEAPNAGNVSEKDR